MKNQRLENWVIFAVLLLTGVFTAIDIYTDVGEGTALVHLTGEALITVICLIGAYFLWRRIQGLQVEVVDQKQIAVDALEARRLAQAESAKWRAEAAQAIRGLSDAIDAQLSKWRLTAAEKEVALLLLKGLSLKEVADVRGVSEKTARAQSFSIYAKSGLAGRAELSAFFLEDLLVPVESRE